MVRPSNTAPVKRWMPSDIKGVVAGFRREQIQQPFGVTHEGLIDLRGLPLPDGVKLSGLRLQRCDLRNARMRGAWIEGSTFDGVWFDEADMAGISDHGNKFTDCSFVETEFRESAVGYRGSAYQKCRFDAADFRRAVFIRPEFDECRFVDCRLKGADFNASSFVRCSFVGSLEDVWFRGGFALPSDAEEFGQPRKNAMNQVSFEKAELHHLTFSDDCDLSTVIAPSTGEYRLYPSWKTRLEGVLEASREWSPRDRQEAGVFVNSYMLHAQNQEWQLLNPDDIRSEYGRELGDRIIRALDGS